ncbi:MAG: transcription antitermination factor NusB [Anaerosomatales bacterium]|nr:transcription antitermination factor NusB [Anaerosomatales bacterium]
MTSPARLAALDALAQFRRRDEYIAPLVERAARHRSLKNSDHALAVLLAKGVVRTRGTLDEAIARFTRIERLEPQILDALRLAAFELLFLKTPAHAAVHEAVSAAKRTRPQAASLVNAVLRRLAADAAGFPWGDPSTDRDALARIAGCPRWLVDALFADLGEAPAREALSALAAEPPVYGRVNTLLADRDDALVALQAEGVAVEPAPPDECAFRALEPHVFARSDALGGDVLFACDAAAQYVALQVTAGEPRLLVEVGAGRGTKTLVALGRLASRGATPRLVAVEPNEWRARTLAQRLARSGISGIDVIVADVRDAAARGLKPGSADAVLVDAPCTGTGTLRRHPEAVWRLTPDDVTRLSSLQREILEAASVFVREGGILVYSTCSVLVAENEDVVNGFLGSVPGASFAPAPLEPQPPAEWRRFATHDGFFRSWPSTDGPDGHFVARLMKSG